MEISAWEMLRDVLPANRRILPLDIVKHVELIVNLKYLYIKILELFAKHEFF